jgi:GAF domain-containing protein
MGDHEVLFDVLRRFARTMTSRYDLPDVLHELCVHASEVLGAAGAGVSVFDDDGRLRFVTATSEVVITAERAQEEGEEGPCYSSLEEMRPVVVDDIGAVRDRWPGYCRTLEEQGLHAVLGLPLVLSDQRIGAIDVYDGPPRSWSESEVAAASVLADVATAYVANAGELARSRRTTEQLQHALESRVEIEQAKGKLSQSAAMSLDEAFELMRARARSTSRTVRDIAREVIERGPDVVR